MPGLSKTVRCRRCQKEIAFIQTVKGKSMPVNPTSIYFVPAGGPNTYVMLDGTVQRGREPQYADKNTQIGYISHFATCPDADKFRKRK